MIQGISHLTFIVHDIEKTTILFKKIFKSDIIYDSGHNTFSLSKERFFLIGNVWVAVMQGNSLTEKTYNHISFQ